MSSLRRDERAFPVEATRLLAKLRGAAFPGKEEGLSAECPSSPRGVRKGAGTLQLDLQADTFLCIQPKPAMSHL
jgi:hypothetical protein